MSNQNIIVFQFNSFFKILKELENDINFTVVEVSSIEDLKLKILEFKDYLIITKEKIDNFKNQVLFEKYPIHLKRTVEKINIELLKKKFNDQSEINIKKYKINLNSREIFSEKKKLKLTEKEVQIILYLSNTSKAVSAKELENNVWKYQNDLETHTVETHIYRLRKKLLKSFNDKTFISSEKHGYKI